jgi:Fe2+ or Zn2+ uptake regulation protein
MNMQLQAASLEAELVRQGFRLTKLRKALLRIFMAHQQPLALADLQKILRKHQLSPHKVTLYRELEFLKDQRVIAPVTLNDGLQRFEYVHLPHHHHAVCMKCKKIEDLELENDAVHLEKLILTPHNFKIMHHALEFFGVCNDCK